MNALPQVYLPTDAARAYAEAATEAEHLRYEVMCLRGRLTATSRERDEAKRDARIASGLLLIIVVVEFAFVLLMMAWGW